jgi:hypothetical protein
MYVRHAAACEKMSGEFDSKILRALYFLTTLLKSKNEVNSPAYFLQHLPVPSQ